MATLAAIAVREEPCCTGARGSFFIAAQKMTSREYPASLERPSQRLLSEPAPRRPGGENSPGKIRRAGIFIVAANGFLRCRVYCDGVAASGGRKVRSSSESPQHAPRRRCHGGTLFAGVGLPIWFTVTRGEEEVNSNDAFPGQRMIMPCHGHQSGPPSS